MKILARIIFYAICLDLNPEQKNGKNRSSYFLHLAEKCKWLRKCPGAHKTVINLRCIYLRMPYSKTRPIQIFHCPLTAPGPKKSAKNGNGFKSIPFRLSLEEKKNIRIRARGKDAILPTRKRFSIVTLWRIGIWSMRPLNALRPMNKDGLMLLLKNVYTCFLRQQKRCAKKEMISSAS